MSDDFFSEKSIIVKSGEVVKRSPPSPISVQKGDASLQPIAFSSPVSP